VTLPTWPIYLKLQTDHAYGPSPDGEAQCAASSAYIDRIGKERPMTGSLLIGPGGPDEVRWFRGVVQGPIHVITAHGPELAAIDAAQIPDVLPELGDIHDMPYLSGIFDFVHAANVLEHTLAPYIAMMECRRVLRLGGVANFVLPPFDGADGGKSPFHLHCLTREVWVELMHKVGLEVTDVEVRCGTIDPSVKYSHYRALAVAPPAPHDKILHELVTFKAIPR